MVEGEGERTALSCTARVLPYRVTATAKKPIATAVAARSSMTGSLCSGDMHGKRRLPTQGSGQCNGSLEPADVMAKLAHLVGVTRAGHHSDDALLECEP